METFICRKSLLFIFSILTGLGSINQAYAGYYLVYSPNVEYGETEIELYAHRNSDDDPLIDGAELYVLEIGAGITPRLFLEGKVIAARQPAGSTETTEYAIEGIYQITEQGEYAWDIGMLAEVVYSKINSEISEVEIGGIFATEMGQNMSFTTNLIAEYEKAESKMEGSLRAQLKWRLQPSFEPAVEVYADEYSTLAGPVIMGKLRAGDSKFGYELGLLLGMDDKTPDSTLKAVIEYEF